MEVLASRTPYAPKEKSNPREEPPDPANGHDREEGASREEEEECGDLCCAFHACIIAKGKSKVKRKRGKRLGGIGTTYNACS